MNMKKSTKYEEWESREAKCEEEKEVKTKRMPSENRRRRQQRRRRKNRSNDQNDEKTTMNIKIPRNLWLLLLFAVCYFIRHRWFSSMPLHIHALHTNTHAHLWVCVLVCARWHCLSDLSRRGKKQKKGAHCTVNEIKWSISNERIRQKPKKIKYYNKTALKSSF